MGRIFEYLNLKKEIAKSKEGRDYTKYIVVSNIKGETFNIKDKLKALGFKWDARNYVWYIFGNNLTHEILDGLKQINNELKSAGGQTENIEDFISSLETFRELIANSAASPKAKVKLTTLLDQYIEDIANATDARAVDAEIQKYMEFSHKFHNYSFLNSILIYIQDNTATKVAGKKKWESLGRQVIDLNKKITINCFNEYYIDPTTGKRMSYSLDQKKSDKEYVEKVKAGTEKYDKKKIDDIEARKKIIKTEFNDCDVYDVANTTGEPLPDEPAWKGASDERADAIALFNIAKKSLEKLGVTVTQNPASRGEGGWSRLGHINVTDTMKGSGAASTIFHEWAHDLLHQENGKYYSKAMQYFEKKGQLTYAQIKQIKEIQAETVSAVLCKHYDLPATHHPTYMALWQNQGGLNSKDLIKENIETVREVSNFIIKQIELYRDEFDKAKVQMQQQGI
jgi:hypothetical protein